MTAQPLVFLDVDGVLNPDDRNQEGFTTHRIAVPGHGTYRVALNPAHGPKLLELAEATGAQLVWGTTWSQHANPLIAPHVGLQGGLPYVLIDGRPRWGPDSILTIGEWKARQIVAYADGRPFVWLDDEPDAARAISHLAYTHTVGPHLAVPVNPRRGLTDDDLAQARAWLHALNETADGTTSCAPSPEAIPDHH